MHGAAFFCSGAGRGRRQFFLGGAGQNETGMVIIGHMSLKCTFSAKNTAQKFLIPRSFGDVGTFAPILALEQFSGGAGWGRVEYFWGRARAGHASQQNDLTLK